MRLDLKPKKTGWMRSQKLKEIQDELTRLGTAQSVEFSKTVIPGVGKIYGVKTPHLNRIAAEYREGSFPLVKELWKSGAHEEKVIAIKIVEKIGKTDPAQVLALFRTFSRSIGNWAVCDGLGMQFLRGVVRTHSDGVFNLAEEFSVSSDPWQRRLSLVMVEWYTRHTHDHKRIMKLVKRLENDEEYYVRKAVQWIYRNFEKGK